jgi:hypothetical protein
VCAITSSCRSATAEVPALPGVLAYGATQAEAEAAVRALAACVIDDMTEEERAAVSDDADGAAELCEPPRLPE